MYQYITIVGQRGHDDMSEPKSVGAEHQHYASVCLDRVAPVYRKDCKKYFTALVKIEKDCRPQSP